MIDKPALAVALALPFLLTAPARAGQEAPAEAKAEADAEAEPKAVAETKADETLFPYPWEQRTLDNGLKVIVIPMPVEGLVSYRTVVRTGARDEYEKGVTGFAHFFEHMMFRGTKKYPADRYNEIVTRMGADSNAYTSTDMTVYEFDIAAEDLPTVVEIEADRFMNLDYDKQGFETEAGAVYGEYRKNRSSPFFVLYEAIRGAAYTKHTYAHTTMGFVEDIKAMPKKYKYSRSFFERYYRPENSVVVVAGDVEAEPTFALIEDHYGAWKPGYVAPKIKAEPEQKKARRIDVEYEGKTLPIVWVAYKGGAFDPEDRTWVASLVLAELAFGETSDIYRELALDEQIVEDIGAGAADSRDPGLWSIFARIKDPADIDKVLARVDEAVARYRDQLPDAARLDAVKSHMRYSFLLDLDTTSNVAAEVAAFVGVAGELERIERLYDNLQAVTPADIQAAAQRWLVEERRTVAVLREAGEGPPDKGKQPKKSKKAKKGGK